MNQISSPSNPPATAQRKPLVRVLLVDDHPIVREGLTARIESEGDMTVCATAESAEQAMVAMTHCQPDVVVTDLSLSGKPGLELIKDFRVQYPTLPVVVLSIHDENLWAERALRAGAQGYVMKSQATEKVMDAIRRVLAGGIWISDHMSSVLLGKISRGKTNANGSPLANLSDRELEVFQMIGGGQSIREIAAQLHLSAKTIEVHREHIKDKLGVKSSAELLRYAVTYALEG